MKRFKAQQLVVVNFQDSLRVARYLNLSTVKQQPVHEVHVSGSVGDEFVRDHEIFATVPEARQAYPKATIHPSLDPNSRTGTEFGTQSDPWAQY